MAEIYLRIGLMLAVIALMSGWMFISATLPAKLKIVSASLVTFLSIAVWMNAVDLRGYSVEAIPHDGVEIIGVSADMKAGRIYIWVNDSLGPRVYAVPYSDELINKLLGAKRRAGDVGGRMFLHFGDNKGGRGYTNIPREGDLPNVTVDVVSKLPPKD